MDHSSVSFSALERLGEGTFRLEWFGNVIRGATDKVVVVFAPWEMDPDTGEVRSNSDKRISVSVPVAYLRKFRIGDIWEDGINTGRRDTSTRETFQLDIAEGTAQVMPVGVPINSDRQNPEYPLPFSAFGSHRNHTHAQCVRIQLDDNSTFVVPCMELVRFYFGASGSFLKRLFSGAFALDKLYTRARINRKTFTANIDLAPDLSGVAAATVARIALDRQARSAARWIVNSGTATSANVVSYYPKTTFPFFGATDLTVYGRWIIQGDRRVFFAEQLVRCTHSFPFFTLYYTTSRSLMKRAEVTGASSRDPDKVLANMPEPDFPTTHLTEQSVSSVLQPVGIPIGVFKISGAG